MYDHNQTLVPEAFLALYVRHERLTLARQELEARWELCEDLALHTAESLTGIAADARDSQRDALSLIQLALLTAPAQVTEPETRWVMARVIELRGWDTDV